MFDHSSRPVDHASPWRAGTLMLPLVLHQLTYAQGGRHLVDRIDLELTRPGVTVIMGYNGAGKSLLLRLCHGLIAPTSGSVTWAGEGPDDELRRRQAMVFQRPVLLRRSVAQNVDFALKVHSGLGFKARREACNVLLERVGLAALAGQPARRLSGGEQQRLSLARALASDPDVLLLDEPTASLDPASIAVIEAIVKAETARATKVIFVTHDVAQARRMADEVVFMHQGRIAAHAPSDVFFEAPDSEAAAAYIAGRLYV